MLLRRLKATTPHANHVEHLGSLGAKVSSVPGSLDQSQMVTGSKRPWSGLAFASNGLPDLLSPIPGTQPFLYIQIQIPVNTKIYI